MAGCTPKPQNLLLLTIKEEVATTVKPPKQQETLSPCPKFKDAPNPDDAETHYVLYRDFLKVNEWNKAFQMWKKVYEVSPAADTAATPFTPMASVLRILYLSNAGFCPDRHLCRYDLFHLRRDRPLLSGGRVRPGAESLRPCTISISTAPARKKYTICSNSPSTPMASIRRTLCSTLSPPCVVELYDAGKWETQE